jgi:hypothetical protein
MDAFIIEQAGEETPKPKGRRFDRLFNEFVGDDDVVDPKELVRILNDGRENS